MMTAQQHMFLLRQSVTRSVKVPFHKFHAYHMTQRHQYVCRCPWYIWKSQLEDYYLFFIYFIYAVIDEDEDDKWWCYGGPFRFWDYLTGPQTMLTVTIIPVLTRPGNCGTCSVGQVIRATPSKTHLLSGWSLAVWFQPSHWAHSTPSSG